MGYPSARHKTALREIPAFMALEAQGVYVGVRPPEEWHEPNLGGPYFSDPMEIIASTGIPVLAVFGEMDTQADPVQGAEAYREALRIEQQLVHRYEWLVGNAGDEAASRVLGDILYQTRMHFAMFQHALFTTRSGSS